MASKLCEVLMTIFHPQNWQVKCIFDRDKVVCSIYIVYCFRSPSNLQCKNKTICLKSRKRVGVLTYSEMETYLVISFMQGIRHKGPVSLIFKLLLSTNPWTKLNSHTGKYLAEGSKFAYLKKMILNMTFSLLCRAEVYSTCLSMF